MPLSWTILRLMLLTPWLGYLCWSDATSRRLPNALTLGGLAAGLCVQAGWYGWPGLKGGLWSAAVAILFLLFPFLLRAAGAGDVKMLAACAAFLSLIEMPFFLIAVSFSGFFVAVAMLLMRQVSSARLKHCFRSLFDWRYDRKAGRQALPPGDDERARVPFGIAIAIGMWATLAAEALM